MADARKKKDQTAAPPDNADRWSELTRRFAQVLPDMVGHQLNAMSGREYSVIDYPGIFRAFGSIAAEALRRPEKIVAAQADFLKRNIELFEQAGRGEGDGLAAGSTRPDRRFKDKAWSEHAVYRLLREAYLRNSDWVLDQLYNAEGVEARDKRKAAFYTRQMLSALSPANFPFTNPQVVNKIEKTQGEVVLKGLENLVRDLEKGGGRLAISQTNDEAFEVGRNLATTPGKVVFRNDLIELIQYTPTTDEVFEAPFLMVPHWINKYYILDLRPENSFLKWLVSQGHTVFVISWVNPGEAHADKSFEDYMREGPLEAIRVVREITGAPDINLGGFCIGGILSVCMLAYLSKTGDIPIRSATLLATLVDTADVGECSIFIDESQIANIERFAAEAGYIEGHHMMDMFSLLRENDLIWNYVVNNYLLGRDPVAFDMLYWNSDSTRLPARMLTDYLRHIVLNNALARAGGYRFGDVPLDVRAIETSCYFVSTIDDHIAPWTATYPATQSFSGPCTFVLGGSGHIAGIINPPDKSKYSYRTSTDYPPDPIQWLQQAEEHDGSWWPHWAAWVAGFGGDKIPARQPGSDKYPALCDAPGAYVLER